MGVTKGSIEVITVDRGMNPYEPIPDYHGPIEYGEYHDEATLDYMTH